MRCLLLLLPLLLPVPGAVPGAAAQQAVPTVTQRSPVRESVTVTATDRGLAGLNDAATSVALLDRQALEQQPGLTLDDSLHQVAGFQLFRRSSSWTANPTTEGVSLRGLGSTAASRSLVVSDEVPLNDPFGGWVHWNEIPTLAIDSVALLRGGASDLYGSSAIGGVINIVPAAPFALLPSPAPAAAPSPFPLLLKADALGATENTGVGDALLASSRGRLGLLAATTILSTGGYIPSAPAVRGSVDTPANVSSQAARLELRSSANAAGVSGFLRGNLLNETRSNGTPLQNNAARLWRYQAGLDFARPHTSATLRLFGSRENYRQSFTSVAPDRNSERLTRVQHVPTDELGLVAQASRRFARSFAAALGFDVLDIRATDAEYPGYPRVPSPTTPLTSARQRAVGGFADALWQPGGWSLSASVRLDSFRTFDARQFIGAASTPALLPAPADLVASPRAGLVRLLPHGLALTATAFRAFRGPTLNELYRTGQVGQQTTLANPSLLAERATGFEAGGDLTRPSLGHLRATYFWTEVNRPVSAVLLSQTATAQTLQRENLGQIRSRGLMIEAQTVPHGGFDASFGYQLAVASVTAFNTSSPAQADLTGNWIPEVPRQSLTTSLNLRAARLAAFHLTASYQGRAFDDAANQFVLHPYARFDLAAERTLPHGLSLYAAAQNLLDRTIEAGRTPTLTLAPPRLVEGGIRYTFAR